MEDDFVSKITDSIASIGRRTQEAIQKINIEETISDIGSTFSKFKGKTEQVFDYDLEKSGDVDSIEVENYNGKITIHGLEDEEEELDEKKDPLDLEFAEGDDFNLNEEESKEDKKEESKGKSPNNIRANIKIFYDDRLNSNKNNRYFDMTKEGSTLIIKPLNEYFRIDSFEANIDLYLPKKVYKSVKASVTNGKLLVKGVEAEKAELKVISGKAMVCDTKLGDAKVETVDGKVLLEKISGDDLKAKSVSGKLVAEDINYVNSSFELTSGKINIDGVGKSSRKIKVDIVSGNLNISLDKLLQAVKVIYKRKDRNTSNLNFGNRFTSVIDEKSEVIAFSDNYKDDDESSLIIEAKALFGSTNID